MLLRLTNLLFVPVLASGVWLIGAPANHGENAAALAWLHVVVGWALLPAAVAFAARHSYGHWKTAELRRRRGGAVGLLLLAVLLLSGVEIAEPILGLSAGVVGRAHLLGTAAFLVFLFLHLAPVWRARRRGPASVG